MTLNVLQFNLDHKKFEQPAVESDLSFHTPPAEIRPWQLRFRASFSKLKADEPTW